MIVLAAFSILCAVRNSWLTLAASQNVREALDSTFLASPGAVCASDDFGDTPRRVCDSPAIAFVNMSGNSAIDGEEIMPICSSPVDLNNTQAFPQLVRALQDCNLIRFLSDQLWVLNYAKAGPLDKLVTNTSRGDISVYD